MGVEVLWLMDLGEASLVPRPRRHGVRPRPMDCNGDFLLVFTGWILLRLLQIFQAMVLPPVSGCRLLLLLDSGVIFLASGLRQRRWPVRQANRGFPKGFVVFSFSCRGFCVGLVGTAVLCTRCIFVPVCTVSCMFQFQYNLYSQKKS